MKRHLFLVVTGAMALLTSICFANSRPVVSNLSVAQRSDGSGIVDISYSLSDADGDDCTVSLLVSDDGGSTWDISPSSEALSGDIGEGITPAFTLNIQ